MGDNIWKSDNNMTGVETIGSGPVDTADKRLPPGTRNSGSPTKVSNGRPFDGVDVVLPIDGEDLDSFGVSPTGNGRAKLGLNVIDGSVISFYDLSYRIEIRSRSRGCSCRKESQYILKNVSGIFRPGLNVILGPTGSGKTTLLDTLAGRKDPTGCTGDVLVDEKPQPSNFKCMSGYVIQDDIIMGMLTVRENIEFSAALRLPSGTTASQRRERVDEIINDLGLSKCAATRVGTEFVRGISGGERKRTNIAMELITLPRVLFLDEPTTGLDANTAYSVMHLLKRLSQRGMTVILSIHQPRYSIYKLFDTLTLVSHGRSLFHGPATEALDFFTAGNYLCEEHNNPPDFFLDVLSGSLPCNSSRPALNDTNEKDAGLKDDLTADLIHDTEETETTEERLENLVNLYQKSKWHEKLESDLKPLTSNIDSKQVIIQRNKGPAISYPTTFCTQLAFVSRRTWCNMIRNRHALMTQVMNNFEKILIIICSGSFEFRSCNLFNKFWKIKLLMLSAIILGLIVGTIYFQVGTSYTSGIQNRVGAFFFIVMNYVFGNMSAVDIFIKERAVFIHETVSGYYRVSAYFLAKLLFDVGPQRVFPILIFASISYFMIGFQLNFSHFLFYVLNTILTSIAGTSVALMFSATTRQHTIGTVLTALVWVCMMVFSGILVNVSTVPSFLRWLKWLSIFQYSMNAFQVNELKGLVFFDESINGTEIIAGSMHRDTGDDYLSRQGIPHESAWDLWSNEFALFLIAAAFLILTYVQLRRTKTVK